MLASALGLTLVSFKADAQTWPTRSLRAIVPFAAGTITDIVPRVVFEQLSTQLGQSIIVENRPGGGTTTAAGFVAKADPDGYTVLVNSSAHTIAPAVYPNLSYDPATDFSAVAPLGIVPSVLVVSRASGFKTVADFVAAAKAKPGVINFGSAGVGTATHLSAMRFMSSTGMQAVHVPFKGGPEAMKEIIAGRLDFFFAPVGNALPFVKDGMLTALVVNSAKRSAVLPEVPTTPRPVSLMPSIRSGSACSCPQEHRAPSSTSCTARWPKPWIRQVSGPNWSARRRSDDHVPK